MARRCGSQLTPAALAARLSVPVTSLRLMTSKASPWPPRPHRTLKETTEPVDDEATEEMRERIAAVEAVFHDPKKADQ